MPEAGSGIGTLREKPLHASLKRWYGRPGDLEETPVGRFVVDLVRPDGLLVEIQTRGFSSMRQKTATLLDEGHHLRIVHPIPMDKIIVKVDDEGVVSRRMSPKHGHVTDVFGELVSFPELFADPNLEVEVLLTVEEELRRHTPDGPWRRNGWAVIERRLTEVLGSTLLSDGEDLRGLLPRGLPEPFTTADIAEGLGRPRRIGQQMAYCLRQAGAIHVVGKRGNNIEYGLPPETDRGRSVSSRGHGGPL